MPKARPILAGLFLVGFGLLLAMGALEAGVRLLHLVPTRFWEPDPLLGRRLIPGQQGWWTQEEGEFHVWSRITSDGRRDVERRPEKGEGVFRILLLGDSFVEALQVPLEETLARRLEGRLNRDGQRFEVLSFGVSGYGTAGEVLAFERHGRAFHPDLVLLAFYPGNDVRNNSPTLEPVLPPVYGDDGALVRVDSKKRDGGRRGRRGLLRRSEAYQYFRKVLLTGHPDLARHLAQIGLLRRGAIRSVPKVDGVPVDYWVYADPLPERWERAWKYTFSLLGRLRRAAASAGAGLAVVVVSAREQVYPKTWKEILAANPAMRDVHWDLEGPERRLERWCVGQRIPCLRLSPLFVERAHGGPLLHFRHDGHWTAAGHDLAAAAVARFLREQHLVPQ